MKFRVDRDVLEEAVSSTARTLPSRPAIPALAGIKMTAKDGVISLFAFDYEMSARQEFPAEVIEEGEVLVSGKMLANISKQLPNSMVEVQLQESKVLITCGRSKFNLLTMALDEYPEPPEYPASIGKVDGDELAHAINQVAVAASRDDTLPLLATVRMELEGSQMRLMATDRYRLAMRTLSWQPNDPSLNLPAMVKSRKLTEVAKAISGTTEVELSLDQEAEKSAVLAVETNGQKMTVQLTDGDYPQVAALFPKDLPIHAVVNRDAFVQALRRVSLVTQQSAQVKLVFTRKVLVLLGGESSEAEASEEVPCTLQAAEEVTDIQVAFNPNYLREGLSALDSEFVRIAFSHPTKPAVVTGQDEADGEDSNEFRYLLMPIRYAT